MFITIKSKKELIEVLGNERSTTAWNEKMFDFALQAIEVRYINKTDHNYRELINDEFVYASLDGECWYWKQRWLIDIEEKVDMLG